MKTLVVISMAASLALAVPAIACAQATVDSPTLLGLVYQPRGEYPPLHSHAASPPFGTGYFDLHGGVFRLHEAQLNAADFGAKLAFSLAPALRIGTLIDWQHRSDTMTSTLSTAPGPGGTTINSQLDLGSGTSDLVPWLGFIEVGPIAKFIISPYVGGAVGYEWLSLHATRSDIPVPFDATYGGLGWQAWGGVSLTMSKNIKLTGEAYANWGEMARTAYDTQLDATVKEVVNVKGTGIRGGLQFGF